MPLMNEVLAGGGEFRFYPHGTSMLPLVRPGKDSVAIIRSDGKLKKFDIPLYRRDDGAYVLHRVYGIAKDGTYIICGDNQLVCEKGVRPDQIIGKVCCIYRGNKKVPVHAFSQKVYMFLWCAVPIRRACLFIYRRFVRVFKRNV